MIETSLVTNGVKQGCVLAGANIVQHDVLRRAHRCFFRIVMMTFISDNALIANCINLKGDQAKSKMQTDAAHEISLKPTLIR